MNFLYSFFLDPREIFLHFAFFHPTLVEPVNLCEPEPDQATRRPISSPCCLLNDPQGPEVTLTVNAGFACQAR